MFARGVPGLLSDQRTDFNSHLSESYFTSAELAKASPKNSPGLPDLTVIVRGREAAFRAVFELGELPQVAEVGSIVFPSRDRDRYAVIGWLKPNLPEDKAAAQVARSMDGPGVIVGGDALVSHEFHQKIKDDLHRAELIAIPLLLLLGFIVFRSVVSALLPVVVGGFAAVCALALIRFATGFFPISIFALNIVVGLALGLGVDYSLLMVSRFREELSNGQTSLEAAIRTLRSAGRTVAFSSAVIAFSFASLLVFPIPFVRSIAFGGILMALIAGAGTLILLPPLFALLGRRVNALAPKSWQRKGEGSASGRSKGGWYRLARFVMRKPLAVALCSALLLIVLGLPSLSMRFTGFNVDSLPASADARIFTEEVRKEFPHPAIGEIEVAIHGPFKVANPIVAKVEALAKKTKMATVFPNGVEHSARLWQINLNPTHPTYSPETTQFVERLRGLNGHVTVAGETASYIDTSSTLKHYLPQALAILIVGTLLLLTLATKSLVLPIKALIMNLLSLGAAFGLLTLIFQDGRLEGFLDYDSQHALVLVLPVVLASGAFGLLTDYGLFLLMRIKEARDSGMPNREAIALGLERTGRTVTAAATMFAIAVGSFATSGIVLIKEGALGIACAVLLDAFVVRPLLVPSLMALLGEWNWWPARMPLSRG